MISLVARFANLNRMLFAGVGILAIILMGCGASWEKPVEVKLKSGETMLCDGGIDILRYHLECYRSYDPISQKYGKDKYFTIMIKLDDIQGFSTK